MEALTVSSSDLARKFGFLRQANGPIHITHHGRATHVLVPIQHYAPFRQHDPIIESLPSIHDVAEWLPLCFVVVRDNRTIVLANRTAHTMSRASEGSLVGQDVLDAFPTLKRSMFETYLNRAITTGEPCSFDLPSAFREDQWIRFDIHTSGGALSVMGRDITDDVRMNRLADTKQAIVSAIALHGEIGYIRVNVRGVIEAIDTSLCEKLALPEPRLIGLAMADLVPGQARVAFRDTLERVLATGQGERLNTNFLGNDGSVFDVSCAASGLRGTYGNEGAVLVCTLRQSN